MNEYKQTIIVPPGNPAPVYQSKTLKFVIVVDNQALVKRADEMTLDSPANIDRIVIYYKTPDWADLKKRFPELPDDILKIQAFTLSTKNMVADIINTNEEAGYSRIDQAYTKAGRPQFN